MFKLHAVLVCGEVATRMGGFRGQGEVHLMWDRVRVDIIGLALAHLASCLRPNLASAHLVTKNL